MVPDENSMKYPLCNSAIGSMVSLDYVTPDTLTAHIMGSALHRDFTLMNMIIRAVLDAQMNLTLSHITMSVPGCTTFFFLSGDMLQSCHREITFYTTWSLDCSCEAFNMELW